MRNFFIFFATFVVGAVAALVMRAAKFDAHAQAAEAATTADYAPMISNALVPAELPATKPTSTQSGQAEAESAHHSPTSEKTGHETHRAPAQETGSEKVDAHASQKPVNTLCAICGMEVDPSLPTEEYQGKRIGFGCRMCPPKFKANPDKYGPSYLRNERIKR